LRNLATLHGERVLVVHGPPDSGNTYSLQLIQHIAQHPKVGGFLVHPFELDKPTAPRPEELAYQIVLNIAGAYDKIPPQGGASLDRWAVFLFDWVVAEIERVKGCHYLVFDGFSKTVLPKETQGLITGLAVHATGKLRNHLRVVLLSHGSFLHPDLDDYIERDEFERIGLADMVELVIAVAAARKKAADVAVVKEAIQKVLDANPEGKADRGRCITRGLAYLLRQIETS